MYITTTSSPIFPYSNSTNSIQTNFIGYDKVSLSGIDLVVSDRFSNIITLWFLRKNGSSDIVEYYEKYPDHLSFLDVDLQYYIRDEKEKLIRERKIESIIDEPDTKK